MTSTSAPTAVDRGATGRGGPLGFFRNLKTAQKLLVGFLVVTAALGGVGLFAVSRLGAVAAGTTVLYEQNLVPLTDLAKVRRATVETESLVFQHSIASSDAGQAALEQQIADNDAALDQALAAYVPLAADHDAIAAFEADLAAYRQVRDTRLLPASLANDTAQFDLLVDSEAEPLTVPMYADLQAAFDAETAQAGQVAQDAQETYTATRTLIIALVAAAAGLAVVIAMGLGRMIAGPLRRAVTTLEGLAGGRLDQHLDIDTRDEVGDMARALNTASASLAAAMGEIGSNAQTLAAASEELTATSTQLSASAEESSAQAGVVSAAAEQVSANVQTVAAGTEQMGASIREIASNAALASEVATQAVSMAQEANATVSKLGQSSTEVGNVVKAINSIAEQTNLLALNATIEAARAGEAGKGFAVVAGEVKELAQETARATEDISRRVETIQADTAAAVTAIEAISEIIATISDRQTTIASAVEEQTATTNEMSRNVSEAADGAGDIARNVTGVARAAQDTTGGAAGTSQAATELSRMASGLQNLVGRFHY